MLVAIPPHDGGPQQVQATPRVVVAVVAAAAGRGGHDGGHSTVPD